MSDRIGRRLVSTSSGSVHVWTSGGEGTPLLFLHMSPRSGRMYHEVMELFFFESVPAPTTAVAVPERDGFPTENLQPFACPACVLAELPAGIDWFLQTPVLVRLGDGVVECAAEVEASAPECLEW